MTCPCMGCEQRTARCHIDCRHYKDWLSARERVHRPQIEENIMMSDYFFRSSDRRVRNDFRRKKVGRR